MLHSRLNSDKPYLFCLILPLVSFVAFHAGKGPESHKCTNRNAQVRWEGNLWRNIRIAAIGQKKTNACYHCGEDCGTIPITLEEKIFCCNGCKTVYEILSQSNACEYYGFESHPGLKGGNTVQLMVKLDKSNLIIQFPSDFRGKSLTGTIDLYRPSAEKLDEIIPLAVDTSLSQCIPLRKLSAGRYVAKIDWSSEGKNYFKELDVFIP